MRRRRHRSARWHASPRQSAFGYDQDYDYDDVSPAHKRRRKYMEPFIFA